MGFFPIESSMSYERAIDYIKWLGEKYSIDERDIRAITNLYDAHYWQTREYVRVVGLVSALNDKVAQQKYPESGIEGRSLLSDLVPATYKPVRKLD